MLQEFREKTSMVLKDSKEIPAVQEKWKSRERATNKGFVEWNLHSLYVVGLRIDWKTPIDKNERHEKYVDCEAGGSK